jgi:uncharacterized RDD family membrane protein YckC
MCGRNFCGDCLVPLGGVPTCGDCKFERLASLRTGDTELNLAGPWRRFVAQFVDGLIYMVPGMVLWFSGVFLFAPLSAFAPGAKPPVSPQDLQKWLWVPLFFFLVFSVAVVAYEALMLSAYGQTLGKMALGVKVVTPAGGDIRPGQAWVRAGSRSVMGALYCLGFIDILFIFSARHRTLHDRLAQTVVVNWKQ